MKYIQDDEGADYFELVGRGLEDEVINVTNLKGFGGKDIEICFVSMDWETFDELKEAMHRAEEKFRERS